MPQTSECKGLRPIYIYCNWKLALTRIPDPNWPTTWSP